VGISLYLSTKCPKVGVYQEVLLQRFVNLQAGCDAWVHGLGLMPTLRASGPFLGSWRRPYHARGHVAVHPQRDACVHVAQPPGQGTHIMAGPDQLGGSEMPQGVQVRVHPDLLADPLHVVGHGVGQDRTLEVIEMGVSGVIEIPRSAARSSINLR